MFHKIMFLAAFTISSAAMAKLPSKPLTPANKKQIEMAVKNGLKDPESAKFKWLPVREWGLYCGWVNAKNSYGGYTGYKPFLVMGGVGQGPKADGTFKVYHTEIGGDVVTSMCSQKGFDMTAPPAE